jgi:hypothetical protein
MNNEKINQMIDEVYERYWDSIKTSQYDGFGPTSIKLPTLTKQDFINKCKTDSEFSERWGLLIKETYDLIPHTEDFGDVIITTSKRKNKLIVVYKNEIIEVYE